MESDGEVIEWAVKMARLRVDASLLWRVQRGEIEAEFMAALARKVAAFHASAARGEHIAEFGRFDVVAGNARENFTQPTAQVGITVSQAVLERLRDLTEKQLVALRPLIEERAARGQPCETHGDLHLDHVYLFPEKAPPDDLAIIDCIEFNERFRFADPVADMAFLVMDLLFHSHRDLADAFADAYFQAAADTEGRALLPFYVAYRAAVRAKVEGFELQEKEIPAGEHHAALARAHAHWLLALGQLEEPGRRPCLVLVGGLPGVGKSTLARGLAECAGFDVIRSDVVRKVLATATSQDFYTVGWTERTYAECLRRAEALLFEGRRVLVDASFRAEAHRRLFLDAAIRWGLPALFLLCQAQPERARQRLAQRRGDVSDADCAVYVQAAASWEEAPTTTRQLTCVLSTDGTPEQTVAAALEELRTRSLSP
jgi:aminoglycoside phosphotransferase family enzyme/predicted kinase